MKNIAISAAATFIIAASPQDILARSQMVTCPLISEVQIRESTGKQLYLWWIEDYEQYWRGVGKPIDTNHWQYTVDVTTSLRIDDNNNGFIYCSYLLNKRLLGELKLQISGRYCRFLPTRYQSQCNDNQTCCTNTRSVRCQVVMCSS